MSYTPRREGQPEESFEYHKKHQIGRVKQSEYAQVDAICREIAVPGRQTSLGGEKLDPRKPLRRCGEWVADAVSELRKQGIVTA